MKMTKNQYKKILKELYKKNLRFKKLCDSFDECEGCPFENGRERSPIAALYRISEADIKCRTCVLYDDEKGFCEGWEQSVHSPEHFCMFYQPLNIIRRSAKNSKSFRGWWRH